MTDAARTSLEASLEAMLSEHRLPRAYLESAQQWFAPVADAIALHQNSADALLLVGVNGSQGSGKTTACDYLRRCLQSRYGLCVAVMSLDDFYLTRADREELARTVHPLLRTRGVPGTHDLPLLRQVLQALRQGERPAIPRFDKACDDRSPACDWQSPERKVDIVLLEGWCMGIGPQSESALHGPCNALEREEDSDRRWRTYVNECLTRHYLPLYREVGYWVMLQAPSFDCVFRWRLEQERKLAQKTAASGGNASEVMSEAEVARFIQFYQRLTEHGLGQLPGRVNCTLALDTERKISGVTWREAARVIA